MTVSASGMLAVSHRQLGCGAGTVAARAVGPRYSGVALMFRRTHAVAFLAGCVVTLTACPPAIADPAAAVSSRLSPDHRCCERLRILG